ARSGFDRSSGLLPGKAPGLPRPPSFPLWSEPLARKRTLDSDSQGQPVPQSVAAPCSLTPSLGRATPLAVPAGVNAQRLPNVTGVDDNGRLTGAVGSTPARVADVGTGPARVGRGRGRAVARALVLGEATMKLGAARRGPAQGRPLTEPAFPVPTGYR